MFPQSQGHMKLFLLLGVFFAFIGVAAGAFGAHFLKQRLSPDALNIFEVGVRYQMYHALALLILPFIAASSSNIVFNLAGWLFSAGIILFSGSLYTLALTGVRAWGAVTPIGGVFFLIAWGCMAWAIYEK